MPSLADIEVPAPAPVAAPEPALPAAPAEPALPTPFDAIAAGKLPGLQVPPVVKGAIDPIQEFVATNLHTLQANGVEYRDLPNDVTVLYNPEVISTEQVAAAYENGTLDELIPTPASLQAPAEEAAALAAAPAPVVPGSGASPAGSTPPGVNRVRLANITPPGPGVVPNPVPKQLARRPV